MMSKDQTWGSKAPLRFIYSFDFPPGEFVYVYLYTRGGHEAAAAATPDTNCYKEASFSPPAHLSSLFIRHHRSHRLCVCPRASRVNVTTMFEMEI